MASQLYESVMRNDAQRDALRKKNKPAKSGMHPRGGREYVSKTAKKAQKQALAKDQRPAVSVATVKRETSPRGTAEAAEAREKVAAQQRRAVTKTPSVAVKKATEQPKETSVAVQGNDTPPSALGPKRPAGGSHSLMGKIGALVSERNAEFIPNLKKDVGSAIDFVKGNIKANQQRYENAVKDRVRGGREAGSTQLRGQAAAGAPAPAPGATTKPADTKTGTKPKTGGSKAPRTYSPPANPVAAPPSKPTTTSLGAPKQIHPKRDLTALKAQSKQSLADSKVAAEARRIPPGGGAETVLQSYRGNKSHFTKREK